MNYESGDFGAGGNRPCSATFRFSGELGESFIAFALRRAQRLSLDGWIRRAAPDRVIASASGPQALVDAFEMACSLGPIDASVQDCLREAGTGPVNARGFERRD